MLALVSLLLAAELTFPLWPSGAPGALGNSENDIPTITVYQAPPETATGAAMVIFPGGGYAALARHEGHDYALWLNESGVTAFVVKYRLGRNGYRHPRMLEDAARAVRTVRARAGEWKVDPQRVGVMGSSAGGHLAATLLTHWDRGKPDAADLIERESSRPTLGILCYPVISMTAPHTHKGSRKNLLGDDPSPELMKELSAELQVTSETPPTFLWHTYEDTGVPMENSVDFAMALRRAHVPFDLHIYQAGKHGIGLAGGHPWTKDALYWLKLHGFVGVR